MNTQIDYSIKTLPARINRVNKIINEHEESIHRYFETVHLKQDDKIPRNRLLWQLANYILYCKKQPTYREKTQHKFEESAFRIDNYDFPYILKMEESEEDFEISDSTSPLNLDLFEIDSWKTVLKILPFKDRVSPRINKFINIFNKCYAQCDFKKIERDIIHIYRVSKKSGVLKNKDIANKLKTNQTSVSNNIRAICKKLCDAYEELFTDYYYTFLVKGKYKVCAKCGEIKIVQKFYTHADSPDGYRNVCKDCINDNYKICTKCGDKLNKDLMFSKCKNTRDGYQTWCKICDSERKKSESVGNRGIFRDYY